MGVEVGGVVCTVSSSVGTSSGIVSERGERVYDDGEADREEMGECARERGRSPDSRSRNDGSAWRFGGIGRDEGMDHEAERGIRGTHGTGT